MSVKEKTEIVSDWSSSFEMWFTQNRVYSFLHFVPVEPTKIWKIQLKIQL